ncbi:MAG: hypothetical protein AB7N65_12885 [Vicinamibacterales bacterium]
MKIIDVKNTDSPFGSWVIAVPLHRVTTTLTMVDKEWRAALTANDELFSGKGPSVVMALQSLQTAIMTAAVKRQRRGRAPERVRVAATLISGAYD